MRSIGCGLVCLSFLVLSACSSGQTSLEAQLKQDLDEVLKNVSQNKNLSKKLGKTPPASGLLNEGHISMYVWVKARAMQIQMARINETAKNSVTAAEYSESKSPENGLTSEAAKAVTNIESDLEADLTLVEIAALNELDFDSEMYKWVKQTIETTVEFVDASGDSEVMELVTFYDPVIKHNISLVNHFREKLQFASRVQLQLNNSLQSLQITHTLKSIEKSNLTVESS